MGMHTRPLLVARQGGATPKAGAESGLGLVLVLVTGVLLMPAPGGESPCPTEVRVGAAMRRPCCRTAITATVHAAPWLRLRPIPAPGN